MSLSSSSLFFNNDYGVIDFDFIYDDEITLDVAEFAFDEASVFSPVILEKRICSTSISELLQVRHNLDKLVPFKYFLIRNGLRFDSVFQMQYSRRLGSWTANFHFKGVWNFLFELSCDGIDWQFSMTINYNDAYDALVRFLIIFSKDVFSPENQFSEFSFDFNFIKNNVAKMVVFHDESGIFNNFNYDRLIFDVFETAARSDMLDTESEARPQQAVYDIISA